MLLKLGDYAEAQYKHMIPYDSLRVLVSHMLIWYGSTLVISRM
jgi:hypothetical protein